MLPWIREVIGVVSFYGNWSQNLYDSLNVREYGGSFGGTEQGPF